MKAVLWLLGITVTLLTVTIINGCVSEEPKVIVQSPSKLHSIVMLYDSIDKRFFCSAVVVTPHLAFTAAHCVVGRPLDIPTILVQASKDSDVAVNATVVAYEQRSDMAIIKGDFRIFDIRGFETVPSAIEDMYLSGNKIISCGYPYGGNLACTPVTEVHRCLFQFCAQGYLFPGMSGGPIIDLSTGKVIGVNTAVQENGEIVLSPIVNIFDALNVSIDTQ